MSKKISLASLGQSRDRSGEASPADLIAQAFKVVEEGGSEEEPPRRQMSVAEAKQYAVDVIVAVVQSVISQLDAADMVSADERLEHLTDEERDIVADLVDRATATVTCDFDKEEVADEGEDPEGTD